MADHILPFILRPSGENGFMAETEIIIGDQSLGFIGSSRYQESTDESAEEAIANSLRPLLEQHDVSNKSRMDLEEE